MNNDIINTIAEVPAGYFRIHWPQYQVLMDLPGYDDDVILCMEEAMLHDLPTIALPIPWMSNVKEEMGQKTYTYVKFINTPSEDRIDFLNFLSKDKTKK